MHGRILAVTNRSLCSRPFLEQIRRVCEFRPAALILREKDLTADEYEALAKKVLKLCHEHQVPCILHSFTHVAQKLGVKSIHLPLHRLQEDLNNGTAYGFETIGVSVHSVEEARLAQSLGAAYLTAGHIYATACKQGVPPRGTSFLREVCGAVSIPVYAIGGIRLDQGQIKEVLDCGAAGGCVMSGMMEM